MLEHFILNINAEKRRRKNTERKKKTNKTLHADGAYPPACGVMPHDWIKLSLKYIYVHSNCTYYRKKFMKIPPWLSHITKTKQKTENKLWACEAT